jgi:hypothetical protein
MEDLIKALQIFLKYSNTEYPTHCEHDVLQVDVDPELVSEEDKIELKKLSFSVDEEFDCFYSYRFGSC